MPTTTLASWTTTAGTHAFVVEHYDDSPVVYLRHVSPEDDAPRLEISITPGENFRIDGDSPTDFALITTGFRIERPYGNPDKTVRKRMCVKLTVTEGTPTATVREQVSRPQRKSTDTLPEWGHTPWNDVSTAVITPDGITTQTDSSTDSRPTPTDATPGEIDDSKLPSSLQ